MLVLYCIVLCLWCIVLEYVGDTAGMGVGWAGECVAIHGGHNAVDWWVGTVGGGEEEEGLELFGFVL